MIKIIADTHCHTVFSTHAYSTAGEVISQAAKKGLYAVALTDHGNAMPGAPSRYYFEHMRAIPPYVEGVRVLTGIEANVISYDGALDCSVPLQKKLDWVVASMHAVTLPVKNDIELATEGWLGVAKNENVNVIGHCGTMEFKFDYERVIPEFGRTGKLVEINANTFFSRPESIENCKTIALLCKKHRVPVVLNSDAHFYLSVGAVEAPARLLEEIDFPVELIVNADLKRFISYLETHGIRV
jgi:putative hydrolase